MLPRLLPQERMVEIQKRGSQDPSNDASDGLLWSSVSSFRCAAIRSQEQAERYTLEFGGIVFSPAEPSAMPTKQNHWVHFCMKAERESD